MSGGSIEVMHPVLREEGGSMPTPPLQKSEWNVKDAPIDEARSLVERFHYARGAANTRTYLHGLYGVDGLVGIVWWIPPTKAAAKALAGDNWQGVLCLSRMVMRPEAPKNACSFLLSKSVRMIPADRWPVLVTYADTWQGHDGRVYLAAGWRAAGSTAPEATFTLNGRLVARKAGPKTRTKAEMFALGAKFVGRYPKSRFVLDRRAS